MRIKCNRPGGFKLFHVKLVHGVNEIKDEHWLGMEEKLDPKFLQALTIPIGDNPAQLELLDETPVLMSAKDKIALAENADTLDALDALSKDETRKTVIVAIEKRLEQLLSE
jgi:hypothetical protein